MGDFEAVGGAIGCFRRRGVLLRRRLVLLFRDDLQALLEDSRAIELAPAFGDGFGGFRFGCGHLWETPFESCGLSDHVRYFWYRKESHVSIPKVSIRQVKAARELLGWSQEDLALHSGISVPTIKRLEA